MSTVDVRCSTDLDRLLLRPLVYPGAGCVVPLGADAEDLSLHRSRRGLPMLTPDEFADGVSGSELTGRGGAHVPAAWKLTAARESGPGGTVVINGAEGEPGSAKDQALLQTRPHLVLEGALASAEAIQAHEIVVWVHESATASRARIADAIRERRDELDVRVRMLLAPEGYVGGEASAVISAVRGGPALPQHSRDRARPWGDGPAVLVHNAETHARLGLLALGRNPVSTSLLTIAESAAPLEFTRRTVLESEAGMSFAEAISAAGAPSPQAVLLGGMGGTWVRWSDLADLPIDPWELRAHGLSLGAGIVHLLPHGRDGLAESAAILDRVAAESARQCGPCIFGLPALADAVRRTARGRDGGETLRISGLLAGRGACRHPDGAARMAMSAQEVFGS
ncbi:MAG: NADH-ubiquinone oxidoreductase-F iron-sulfur binding region domain-containing protein [Candidatus Nanopelagicales bacterium]